MADLAWSVVSANPIWIAGYFGPVAGASPVWIAPGDGTVSSAVQSEIVSYYAPVAGATAVWIAGFFAPPPAAIGATPIIISGWGGSGGGGPPPVTSVWSAADAAANGMTLSNGGLTVNVTAASLHNSWQILRGSISKTAGKVYVEFIANAPMPTTVHAGLASTGVDINSYLGASNYSVGMNIITGPIFVSAGFASTGGIQHAAPINSGDVIGFAIDFAIGNVWFSRNNVWDTGTPGAEATPAVGGDPFGGVSPLATFTPATVGALFPAMAFADNGGNGVWTLQSTAASQKYAPPAGFSAWDASGSSAAFTFPGAPIGLYSLRKVGSGYAGQCLKVQRSSDNTRQDIGFDANGNVNMSAIAAFCAGSQAFVFTWYDQSGNARDLIYGNGALPQINMVAGRPWVCFYNQSGPSGAPMLFTAAAPNLTADMTVGFVGQLGTDYCCMPINQWNGSNGWFTTFNGSGFGAQIGATPGIFQIFSSGSGGVALPDTGRYFARTNRYVAKRSGSTGTLYVNGATTKTGGLPASLTTTSPLAIGGDATTGYPFTGLMGEVYVYSSAISDTDRNSIDGNQAAAFPDTGFSTPYSGTSCVQFDWQEQISCGAVLTYERTNSWTAFGAVQLFFFPPIATVLYTNVLTQPWFGHELWIDASGHLRVRLMGNWNGGAGAPGMAAVIGTTNVIDGKKHMLAYSYNGSSTAAGIKVYIDGLPETTTVESDTLAASMVGGTQNLIVGNQAGAVFDLTGTLSHFQIDNVARSASYIAAYKNGAIPPIDANTGYVSAVQRRLGHDSGR